MFLNVANITKVKKNKEWHVITHHSFKSVNNVSNYVASILLLQCLLHPVLKGLVAQCPVYQ